MRSMYTFKSSYAVEDVQVANLSFSALNSASDSEGAYPMLDVDGMH